MKCENAFDLIQKPHATRYGGQTAVSVGGSGGDTSLLYSGGIHLFQYLAARRYIKKFVLKSLELEKIAKLDLGHFLVTTSGGTHNFVHY